MIEMLNNQVKAGTITLEDAQEEVKIAILGKRDEDGNRPINSRLNLGKDGFIFIINSRVLNSHIQTLKGRMYGMSKQQMGFIQQRKLSKLPTMVVDLLFMNGHFQIILT